MTNKTEAEKLLTSVCAVDTKLDKAMDEETKTVVLQELTSRFEPLVEKVPHLLPDIRQRIINYHSLNHETSDITDFIHLVEWYAHYLTDNQKPTDYWSPEGQYYNLRMNEVINLFLISKVNIPH